MGLRFPVGAAAVALLGFVLAAMWIDTVASELVSMLEYFGLLSGINHTVHSWPRRLLPALAKICLTY
jgi:hypothetical protein